MADENIRGENAVAGSNGETLDPWLTVPSAGQPEDGELEQTGVPVRETEEKLPNPTAKLNNHNFPMTRLETIVRTALAQAENVRREGGN